MANLTSAFRGITTPIADLYHEIHQRGWQVTKVGIKDGTYVAEARNPNGETASKNGRDANTALAALLLYVVRREHIRTTAWNKTWVDQLEPIAQSYAKAPQFDPKAALAWKELADDSVARAAALAGQIQIEYTDDPSPYESPQKLWEDVQKKQHLLVSRADAQHPVWTEDQVLAFRICHDVLGHATAGADWSWTGANLAAAAHMPHLSPNAQRALFTETIGQSAYNTYHRGYGPTKITFLDEHLAPHQEQNPDGHGGEHPSMALAPGLLPSRQSDHKAMTDEELYEINAPQVDVPKPDPNCKWCHGLGKITDAALWSGEEPGPEYPCPKCMRGRVSPTTDLRKVYYKPNCRMCDDKGYIYDQGFYVDCHKCTARPTTDLRLAGVKRDPNYRYDTGIEPPEFNALTAHGDPLEHMTAKEMAHKLDTDWQHWTLPDGHPDLERMKQAIVNAFRVALLSPKKELRWNATQYQDLMHIPYHVTDPMVYWNALKEARIHHNRSLGDPNPEQSYQAHYRSLVQFYRYYQKHHPELSPTELKAAADREVMIMQAEIERQHLENPDTADITEPKVYKELDKRLKKIMKDDKPLGRSAGNEEYEAPDPMAEAQKVKGRYGGVIANQLIAIANVSRYADLLVESALEDVRHDNGKGHIFRATALSLGIPFVGPKVVSFAWLLLQPLTSQLATIDTHISNVLGYKQVPNTRDYFMLERELQAGRDASGYEHMPLGQFQWAIWDHKRTGPGTHQDHSPLRVDSPQPYHTVHWHAGIPVAAGEWQAPPWWEATKPYRDEQAAAWHMDVAPYHGKSDIPWANVPVQRRLQDFRFLDKDVPARTAGEDGTADEVHVALDVPEWIRLKIANFVNTLGLPSEELVDPAEYHITVAYAEHGASDVEIQHLTAVFNLAGTKFEGIGLTKLGDQGALVIELTSPTFDEQATVVNEWLEDHGINVSRYEGGFKPHITVAYTDAAPSGKIPPLSFRSPGMSFSTPRKAPQLQPFWSSIQGQPLYHSTDAELEPGDIIEPPSITGRPRNHPRSVAPYDPAKVYLWTEDNAYPTDLWGAYAYEVEPLGPVEQDPEHGFDPDDYDSTAHSWVTPRARVIRRISTDAASPASLSTRESRVPHPSNPYTESNSAYLDRQAGWGDEDELSFTDVRDMARDMPPPAKPRSQDYPRYLDYLYADDEWRKLVRGWGRRQYVRPPGSMYHVSPKENHESIMQNGLLVNSPNKNYYPGYAKPGVYFSPSLTQVPEWQRDYGPDANVYKVDTVGLDFEPDPNHPDAWIGKQDIPPDRIQHYTERGEWDDYEGIHRVPYPRFYRPQSRIKRFWRKWTGRDRIDAYEDRDGPEEPRMAAHNVESAMTRTQLLQQAQAHEQVHGPDTAETVHEFPDGWTMKHLKTYGDMFREGELMSNCFSPQQTDVHDHWYDHPETENFELPDDAVQPRLLQAPIPHPLYSLRDPHNLPHVSIDPYAESLYDTMVLGRHNSQPKPEYLRRVQEWAIGHPDPDVAQFHDIHDEIMSRMASMPRMAAQNLEADVDAIRHQIVPDMTCHDVAHLVEMELRARGHDAEMTASEPDGRGHFWVRVGDKAIDLWSDDNFPQMGIVPAEGEYQGTGRAHWSASFPMAAQMPQIAPAQGEFINWTGKRHKDVSEVSENNPTALNAYDGDKIIGSILAFPDYDEPSTLSIESIWVDPAHRRQGIAKQLTDAAHAYHGTSSTIGMAQTPEGKAYLKAYLKRTASMTPEQIAMRQHELFMQGYEQPEIIAMMNDSQGIDNPIQKESEPHTQHMGEDDREPVASQTN